MIKKYAHVLLSLALSGMSIGSAQALTTGDVAFTAFNADEDGWAMVTFADLAANTTLYFSDNEWNGSAIGAGGAFNTGESYEQWNSGASVIAAGSVIRFSAVDLTSLSSSMGTLSRVSVSGSTNYGISATADTIYAYLGSSATAPTTFLSAISSGAFSVAEGTLAGTGLTVGVSATQLSNASDFAEYTGARSGASSFASYQSLVANVANWDDKGDGVYAGLIPNTSIFSVAAVPEPGNYAMLLAGLGMMGFIVRRRTR